MSNRIDAVFIRKSSATQDDQAQIKNVETMLEDQKVSVPKSHWYICEVSRAKVRGDDDFKRLMSLVDEDRVKTVYVESLDRFGGGDVFELFSMINRLKEHGTKLYDLKLRQDLTERSDTGQFLAFLGGVKSSKERQDLAYRSLRTRVNDFQATGSWPTGTHPFGYGKACYSADGQLLWVWQPINRSKGQVFNADADGVLTPGLENDKLPRKSRHQLIKLVPSSNPKYVEAVRLVFDLYTRAGLSRRKIAIELNKGGYLFNGKAFSHADIVNILRNPAYMGDTYFGKNQTGEFYSFESNGLMNEVKEKQSKKRREVTECLIKKDTHEGLVDRETFDLAQKKLASEKERPSHSPRNPAYFLKQLFVCGHCGKGLTGRTERNPRTKEKTVMYVCPTYVGSRVNGLPVECGYQRITHTDAEQLLLEKMKELKLELDDTTSVGVRANLESRLALIGHQDEASQIKWEEWLEEGVEAFLRFLRDSGDVPAATLQRLKKVATQFYTRGGQLTPATIASLPSSPTELPPGPDGARGALTKGQLDAFGEFKKLVKEAELATVKQAKAKLIELREEHGKYTKSWVKATEGMQRVIKQEIDKLEREIALWEPREIALTDRLKSLRAAEQERSSEMEKLLEEWPTLENREKGEAMRRLFSKVTLFWEKSFHPSMANPPRTRKTTRQGRNRYHLRKDLIRWSFTNTGSESSW